MSAAQEKKTYDKFPVVDNWNNRLAAALMEDKTKKGPSLKSLRPRASGKEEYPPLTATVKSAEPGKSKEPNRMKQSKVQAAQRSQAAQRNDAGKARDPSHRMTYGQQPEIGQPAVRPKTVTPKPPVKSTIIDAIVLDSAKIEIPTPKIQNAADWTSALLLPETDEPLDSPIASEITSTLPLERRAVGYERARNRPRRRVRPEFFRPFLPNMEATILFSYGWDLPNMPEIAKVEARRARGEPETWTNHCFCSQSCSAIRCNSCRNDIRLADLSDGPQEARPKAEFCFTCSIEFDTDDTQAVCAMNRNEKEMELYYGPPKMLLRHCHDPAVVFPPQVY